jgi:hypothetical protein
MVVEHRVIHPDGSVRWLESHVRAVFSGTGSARSPDVLIEYFAADTRRVYQGYSAPGSTSAVPALGVVM